LRPVRPLTLALFLAISLWTVAYYLTGNASGLLVADMYTQLDVFIACIVDYGGWVLGLALCPGFAAAVRRTPGQRTTIVTRRETAIALRPFAAAKPASFIEPPGFLLYHWKADTGLLTHSIPIGSFPGPFPFA
jgi:hypothetical protein